MGPSNLVDPSVSKPGFWEHFVDICNKSQQNTELTTVHAKIITELILERASPVVLRLLYWN